MKPVDLVTIEELIPIYKNGEPANAIEVVRIKNSDGESIQYNIVAGKGLHIIGNKAVYIQPDYTIPLNDLFVEYHAPHGEPSKSRLGKKGRVRAIKFNFQFVGNTDPIYSNGILIPFVEFENWLERELGKENSPIHTMTLPFNIDMVDTIETLMDGTATGKDLIKHIDFNGLVFPYQEVLGVEKYVADESHQGGGHAGLEAGDRPSFLYKTDEETIENHKNTVDSCYEDKEVLMFTIKRDGQSITISIRKDPVSVTHEWEKRICSREKEKKLNQIQVSAYKDGETVLHPYFHPELKVKGWFNDSTNTFYTKEEAEQFEAVLTEVRDNWVDTCKRYNVLEKMLEYCQKYDVQLAMRGEIIGGGVQNKKNNYDAKLPEKKIIWFGVDDLSSGVARRIHYGQEHNLIKVCEELGFEYTTELFRGVFTYDEIIAKSNECFKQIKEKDGILIEGVVIRSVYSNRLSVKKICDEYDSAS